MDLKSRFGSGEHIQLSHQSMTWLEKSTKPKQATFGGIGGGKPPEVTWEDGCACIGMLGKPNPHDTPDSARRRKAAKASPPHRRLRKVTHALTLGCSTFTATQAA